MSRSNTVKNIARALPGMNQTRPNGASALATSSFPPHLLLAYEHGNRATRRLAMKNLLHRFRQEVRK